MPAIVEDIADAVTHARFVGTDHSSDGVVLMKILQVSFLNTQVHFFSYCLMTVKGKKKNNQVCLKVNTMKEINNS